MDNFHDEAPEFLFQQLSNNRNALIDAPPGLGKTRAAAKAAVKLVKEKGKRVLIIEPTKTLRGQMVDFIKKEDSNTQVYESLAIGDNHCPVIGTCADPQICAVSKDHCNYNGRKCAMVEDGEKIKSSNLTVTTFSKFLLTKNYFRPYDTIIIDESHGFENAETSFLQTYVLINRIQEVANEIKESYPQEAQTLERLAMGLIRIRQQAGDSMPLEARQVDSIREAIGDEKLRLVAIECSRKGIYSSYRNLYQRISSLHFRMQSVNDNVFFFHEGALYGRPKNMISEVSGFFRERNLALLSATIDKPIIHARECGLDLRRFTENDARIVMKYPEKRRKNRKLIAITDGPNLSKSNDDYEEARQKANKILLEIVRKFSVKTLVLFRSYADHKSAKEFLSSAGIGERIVNIEQADDPDAIEKKLQSFKAKNIVLASASSRLWEGVDIPELRLVVIDSLPYPGKDPLDKEYVFRKGYVSMVKRLKQGLGRIVRSDNDWGAAFVIDKRFVESFSGLKSKLPWYMGDDFQKAPFNQALDELDKFIRGHQS